MNSLLQNIAFREIHLINPMVEEVIMTKIGTVYTLGIWTVKQGNEAAFIRTWDDFAQWTSMNQKGAQIAVLVQDTQKIPRNLSHSDRGRTRMRPCSGEALPSSNRHL